MKKSIFIGVLIALLIIAGIYALFYYNPFKLTPPMSIPCYHIPNFTSEFNNYYENVRINNDACYPSFSFETPLPYSNLGIKYKVTTQDVRGAVDIDDYDSKIKEKINAVESCSDTRTYFDLSDKSPIPINYLLGEYPKFDSCANMSGIIEMMENQKVIRDFLSSQEKFGDYNVCEFKDSGSGNTQALSYSYGTKYGKIEFYVFCDGIKEEMLLILSNNSVTEAYFQNSASESYRQIFPEDKVLLERKPKWEDN